MSNQLIVGVLDGEITDVTTTWMHAEDIEEHFSIGEVYRLASETVEGDKVWRVLQRGGEWGRSSTGGKTRMLPMLLPIKEEEVPQIVRMVALMREWGQK